MSVVAEYTRPDRIEDALAAVAAGARVAAGCTDIFPATTRQILPGPIVDITAVSDLRGITRGKGEWRIGGATTWSDILRADLPPAFEGLRRAAREVGSVQIQNVGTVGGNLCNASPAADGVPPLLTLNAEVELSTLHTVRRMPLDEFLRGVRKTALAADEILTAVIVPDMTGHASFLKLGARKYLVISIVMVAGRIVVERGLIIDAALAVGSCSAVATRLPEAEAALINMPLAAVGEVVTDALISPMLSPISDVRGDDVYRTDAACELVRRVLADLCAEGAM